jgi:predicted transcriptional regulator
MELARHAAQRVRETAELVLVKEPESVTVCFEVIGRSSEEICEELRRQGRALVGYGVVDGRRVIRLACVTDDVSEEDLDAFFDHVVAVSKSASSMAGD